MKNLLSFLMLFYFGTAFSQQEFAPIGAEWYYSKFVSRNPPQANYVKHVCIKDSTIDGELIKVIQKTMFTREGLVELGFEYIFQSGDTISYWKNGEFHELYNFSMSKGDSMLVYSEMPNYCEEKTPYGWINIDTVFSQNINGHNLKSYVSTKKKSSVWGFSFFPIIQKIGSLDYLVPENEGCVFDNPGYGPLRCYSDPEFGIFYNGKEPCDTLTTFPVFSENIKKASKFKLYPNPVIDMLTIDINEEGNYNIEMYNTKGDLLLQQNFCLGNRVDLTIFPSGIYFIIISNNNKYCYDEIIYKK